MTDKEKFLHAYANLPFSARQEIIITINDQPLTWNAAKIEVENDTKTGKEILEKLILLGILK
jgi:hypothetical protein